MEAESREHGLVLAAQEQAALIPRTQARRIYLQAWDRLGPSASPWLKTLLAHLTADVQDDPELERMWDLFSLRMADLATSPVQAAANPRHAEYCRQSYASIFLSLGQNARRAGDLRLAAGYLVSCRLNLPAVPTGHYKNRLVRALEANERLAGGTTAQLAAAL